MQFWCMKCGAETTHDRGSVVLSHTKLTLCRKCVDEIGISDIAAWAAEPDRQSELLEACRAAINTINGVTTEAYLGTNHDGNYVYRRSEIDALEDYLASVLAKFDTGH